MHSDSSGSHRFSIETEFDNESISSCSDLERDLEVLIANQSHEFKKIFKNNYKINTGKAIYKTNEEYLSIYKDKEFKLSKFYRKKALKALRIEPEAFQTVEYKTRYFIDNKFILNDIKYKDDEDVKFFKSIDGKLTFYIRNDCGTQGDYSPHCCANIILRYKSS
jgi:hypothetical protein